MGSRPRTTEFFPRMKVRGAGRRLTDWPSLMRWWEVNGERVAAEYDRAIARAFFDLPVPDGYTVAADVSPVMSVDRRTHDSGEGDRD